MRLRDESNIHGGNLELLVSVSCFCGKQRDDWLLRLLFNEADQLLGDVAREPDADEQIHDRNRKRDPVHPVKHVGDDPLDLASGWRESAQQLRPGRNCHEDKRGFMSGMTQVVNESAGPVELHDATRSLARCAAST